MSHHARSILTAALVLGSAGGCASREAAEQALAESESVITAQHAEAIRYAPEAFGEVMAAYGAARQQLEDGNYRAALQGARAVTEQARQLSVAVRAGKEALGPRWTELHGDVAMMVTALEKRLVQARMPGRRPAGVSPADLSAAASEVDSLKAGLARAAGAWERGDLSDAVHAGERLQRQARELMQRLGLGIEHGARGG